MFRSDIINDKLASFSFNASFIFQQDRSSFSRNVQLPFNFRRVIYISRQSVDFAIDIKAEIFLSSRFMIFIVNVFGTCSASSGLLFSRFTASHSDNASHVAASQGKSPLVDDRLSSWHTSAKSFSGF